MTATDMAIEELRRAGLFSKESDYDGAIGEAVKELLLVFQKQGHSGFSASLTANLFKKLVAGDVLSPLTDDASEWCEVSDGLFQSTRCSYVFKEGGKAYTIQGKVFSDDGGRTYFQNRESRVYFDLPAYPPETERVILKHAGQDSEVSNG